MRVVMALPALVGLAAPGAAQTAAAPLVTVPTSMAPVVAADEAAPQPPAGAALGFAPPERDEAGYRTPNRDLIEAEAVWHVRVAFNVAALACRAEGDEAVAEAYNAVLAAAQVPLAAAAAATQARYQATVGPAWETRFESDMTRLYNFFAQPPVHARFCATAAALLREARGVAPEGFATFARAALPRLEAPFIAFYAAYDDYRGALANWHERHAPVVLATAAVVPVGPPAPSMAGGAPATAVAFASLAAVRLPAGPEGD